MIISLTGMILKGRYCILEKIGQGGQGSLYLAKDMELGVYRAIKEIPVSGKRETGLLRLLSHPALPVMLDYIEKKEYCYLVMEYIPGKSLEALLQEGRRFTLDEILSFGITISEVLHYLHTRKPPVFYGDLKPGNLMLAETGKLYLVDLGSAVSGYRRSQKIIHGTRGYAAPEQYEGFLDEKSDIYSLGKTLLALQGRRQAVFILDCPSLALVLARCCRKNEMLRYKNMKQLQEVLSKLLYKKKRRGLKESVLVAGAVLSVFLGSVLISDSQKTMSFEDTLTMATNGYYEKDFAKDEKLREAICRRTDRFLQKMLRKYSEDREQERLWGLLAANARLMNEKEKGDFYEEQLMACKERLSAAGRGYDDRVSVGDVPE